MFVSETISGDHTIIETVSQWTPIQTLLFVGGVGGGVASLVAIGRWIRKWWRSTANYQLEYSPIQTIIGLYDREISIEARMILHNPYDVTVRLRILRMLTTFGDVSFDGAEGNFFQIDIAANSNIVNVHAPAIRVPRNRGNAPIGGRVDWLFACGKVEKDGSAQLTTEFPVRGDLDVHFFRHGPESRFSPDRDIPAPVMDLEQLERADGQEFHLRDRQFGRSDSSGADGARV